MNTELIEHQLSELEGKEVSIVVSLGGTQSESYVGELQVHRNVYPLTFELQSIAYARTFTIIDVIKVTVERNRNLIYLKNGNQYDAPTYQPQA